MPARQPQPTRRFIEAHTGDDSQLASVRRFRLEEGRAAGSSFAEVRTGTGLEFTVALDRALDISDASYNGKSLCWRSPSGDASPGLYEPQGLGWLRTFFGGLLTTCGLTHAGGPADLDGKHYGLHGRISHTPAEEVACKSSWSGDTLVFEVSGKVRQAILFGEKLSLHRTILSSAQSKSIVIRDIVENTSHERAPLMLLYHFNIGWPVIENGSSLAIAAECVEPVTAHAVRGIEDFDKFHAPTKGYSEKVYFITPKPDRAGAVTCAVVNRAKNFGLMLGWHADELPCLCEWKMMGYRDYVVGIEPSTVFIRPRKELLDKKLMPWLSPGKSRDFTLELTVLDGRTEVNAAMAAASGKA